MYVNHNSMASNVANTLTSHYGKLATSTQRLSSGLRVNSAADDAAGLAIRELMRADIASLNQGVRNANDAISLIQTADGALGIIDEKLIRMKELAEQAATGTYDSTQRLMIESEYQAMASEITRIANATDFNGMKLLDGSLQGEHDGSKMTATGAMKIHFGTGNDSAEDYYYIEIKEMTAQALGIGNASTWQDVQERGTDAFKQSLEAQIKADKTLTDQERANLMADVDKAVEQLNAAMTNATDYRQAHKYWAAANDEGFLPDGREFMGNSSLMTDYLTAANAATTQGGPTGKDEIETKITNAIKDALPVANEVPWETDKEKYGAQVAEMWNGIEGKIKTAAKEAGLLDEEIQTMMYGADGASGLKEAWRSTMTADQTGGKVPPTSQAEGDAQLAAAMNALVDTPGNPGGPDVKGFLAGDHPDMAGTATYGEVIAARNTAYSAYANAADDAKPTVGPADVDQIMGRLQGTLEQAWKTATNEAFNADGTPKKPEEQKAAIDKLHKTMEDAAVELGFTADEAETVMNDVFTALGALVTAGPGAAPPVSIGKGDWDKAYHDAANPNDGAEDELAALKETPTSSAGYGLAKESVAQAVAVRNQGYAAAKANDKLDEFWNGLRDTEKQKLQYAWGQAAINNLANAEEGREIPNYGIDANTFDFKTALGVNSEGDDIRLEDNKMLAQAMKDMQAKVGHMDFAGYTIETQEDAQQALDAINDAITEKDKTRAHLGALQNRLENTVSNLTIQAENLQSAESRISDVDVATEMTNFVRNQILTQSAVAMLSQANSMPQMAMQLIG